MNAWLDFACNTQYSVPTSLAAPFPAIVAGVMYSWNCSTFNAASSRASAGVKLLQHWLWITQLLYCFLLIHISVQMQQRLCGFLLPFWIYSKCTCPYPQGISSRVWASRLAPVATPTLHAHWRVIRISEGLEADPLPHHVGPHTPQVPIKTPSAPRPQWWREQESNGESSAHYPEPTDHRGKVEIFKHADSFNI